MSKDERNRMLSDVVPLHHFLRYPLLMILNLRGKTADQKGCLIVNFIVPLQQKT